MDVPKLGSSGMRIQTQVMMFPYFEFKHCVHLATPLWFTKQQYQHHLSKTEMQNLSPTPDLLNGNLHFNKILSVCTLQYEKP